MGMVGAAFGLGFILGPPVGALLVQLGPSVPGHMVVTNLYGSGGAHSPAVLGYTAAALALVNFLYVLLILPESLRRDDVGPSASVLRNLQIAFQTPALATLLALFFAANFAFSNLESTYFLLTNKSFGLSQLQGAMILGFVGVVSAIIQGGLIRSLTARFGEVNLVRIGFLMQIPTLLLLPFAVPWTPQLATILVLGVGSGIVQPSMGSLISRNAPPAIQGGVFGVDAVVGGNGPDIRAARRKRALRFAALVALCAGCRRHADPCRVGLAIADASGFRHAGAGALSARPGGILCSLVCHR